MSAALARIAEEDPVLKVHRDPDTGEMILSGGSAFELRQRAVQNGMMTLRGSGLQKIRDGMTTLDEVVRETVL